MNCRQKYSRRAFLKATGASPFLMPLLEPGLVRAGCLTNAPKRGVFVLWGNGMLPGNYESWASGPSEDNFTLPPGMESLEPHKSDSLFLDKVDYRFIDDSPKMAGYAGADGHSSMQGMLTGRRLLEVGDVYVYQLEATGPSIDQHLGASLARSGFQGLPSLYQGVRIERPTYAVWRGPKDRIAPDWDPSRIFSKLFAGRDGVAPDPELERRQRGRKSLLDSLSSDFTRFGRVVGTADRARIDRHLESIRSLEKELFATREPLACKPPALDADVKGQGLYEGAAHDDAAFPALVTVHLKLLVAALATDVVRVAVLQLTDGEDWEWGMPWLGFDESHHKIAHAGTYGREGKLKADRWIFSQWADLLRRLKDEQEGPKSLLDNTVVAFMNNMSRDHLWHDVPAFLAGSCGGYFKTGRSLKNRAPGQYHQPLLVSVANAVLRDQPGFVPMTSWGDPEYSSGEMPGLRG